MESKETNITVVVRVRPRNQREIRENSSVCVTAQNNQIMVKANPSASDATTKTFSFDKAFGPGVGQETVFNEVVAGMLEEVLMGYNCTIFAYGQTGTGKTYTMEGDLSEPTLGSGIIPRTLYSLFDQLDNETLEYSVRVSFIELYNEELKDLLSPESDFRKLKLYEDLNKKGSVVIQGLEETLVKNADDVITILQRGSKKRQIAATKMNESSSRSHGIFSITVHIKENTPDGEELLKVGKLNLVDLAGSENIGRSGAENRRAKEAGMINQSLLTLGRVINALVERSPHIPYRESKLTRILQDSLGGRTKTCIIAAVSPSRCSIEETLSTLDYAHRAKNIRNKPEINQKMTKRALIREYINQIERLKSDLLAAREKNGIYLSPESYNTLVAENNGNKAQVEEVSKLMDGQMEEMKNLEAKFKQQTEMLSITTSQLEDAMSDLDSKKNEIEKLFEQTQQLEQSLSEQQFITNAYAETEKQLDSLAAGLADTLQSSVNDLEGLHQKIERKTNVEVENSKLFEEFQGKIVSNISSVEERIHQFEVCSSEICDKITSDSDMCIKQSLELLHTREQLYSESVTKLAEVQHQISKGSTLISQEFTNTLANIVKLADNLGTQVTAVQNELLSSQKTMISQLQSNIHAFTSKLSSDWNSTLQIVSGLENGVSNYLEISKTDRERQHKSAVDTLTQRITVLSNENLKLKHQVESQKENLRRRETQVLSDIETCLKKYRIEWEAALDSTAAVAGNTIDEETGALSDLVNQEIQSNSEFQSRLVEQKETVEKQTQQFSTLHNSAMKNVEETAVESNSGLDKMYEASLDLVKSLDSQVQESLKVIVDDEQKHLTKLHGLASESNKTAVDSITMGREYLSGLSQESMKMQETFTSHVQQIKQNVELQSQELKNIKQDSIQILKTCENVVREHSLYADIPTGATPRKRKIPLPEPWELTKSHEELIHEMRKGVKDKENNGNFSSKLPVSSVTTRRGGMVYSEFNDDFDMEN
ncbi:hypothetical protein HDV06_002282 [Boothiomyces sp. JEL0866]|nr:hypothetical protein HDV06_002282 [Boothiomyces sp. JEL0866]